MDHLTSRLLTSVSPHSGVRVIFSKHNLNHFTKSPTSPSSLLFFRVCVCAKSLQSCLNLCNPMDCSPPGSSVHRILQARILEWTSMSGDFPNSGIKTRSLTLQADSLLSEPPGKPKLSIRQMARKGRRFGKLQSL